jgi:hypothetical protein
LDFKNICIALWKIVIFEVNNQFFNFGKNVTPWTQNLWTKPDINYNLLLSEVDSNYNVLLSAVDSNYNLLLSAVDSNYNLLLSAVDSK